jgi:hypothetical protein
MDEPEQVARLILTLPGQVASEPEINVEGEEPSPKPVAPPERGVQ